jgi:hypothetical protein
MSARATVFAAAALVLACAAVPARSADWREVFAAETDTVVFAAASGALIKAPFGLASRETLWTPIGTEYLVRFNAARDGRRVAWLTQAGEKGLTWLWSWGPSGTRSLLGFPSLQAGRLGALRYEAALPSIDDTEVRGGRLVQVPARSRRPVTHALEWSVDGAAIAFGFDEGLGLTPADSGRARSVTPLRPLQVRLLDPAPFYLAETMMQAAEAPAPEPEFDLLPRPAPMRATGASRNWHLVYPTAGEWKSFDASGFDGSSPWAASSTTVWFADGKHVRAVHAHDPKAIAVAETEEDVLWLEYVAPRDAVAWVSGRTLAQRPAAGGETTTVIELREPCRRVLRGNGPRRGLVSGDTLVVWNPADGARLDVALGGLEPHQLIESPGGAVLVSASRGMRGARTLYRVGHGVAALVPAGSAPLKGAIAVASPSRRRVLWFAPDAAPAARLGVYDIEADAWSEVENPGITGWEPLGAP